MSAMRAADAALEDHVQCLVWPLLEGRSGQEYVDSALHSRSIVGPYLPADYLLNCSNDDNQSLQFS